MGDERKESLALHGLESAGGFLQKKVGDRLDTRYIPRLKFVLDKGVKHSLAVARILEEVLPEADREAEEAPTESEDGSPATGSASDETSKDSD